MTKELNQSVIKRRSGFTIVPNDLISSPLISAKAKAIYCYLSSRPDGWRFFLKDLVNNMKENLFSMRAGLQELEAHGWIFRTQLKAADGKFSGSEIEIFEFPITGCGLPYANNLHADNHTYNNTELNNTDNNNINKKQDSLFEELPKDKKRHELSLHSASRIETWEQKFGRFSIDHLKAWSEYPKLDLKKAALAVEEFRLTCLSKGYRYVNFYLAFLKWNFKDQDKLKLKEEDGRNRL